MQTPVPALIHSLTAMSKILTTAEAHAERREADKALAAIGGDDRAAHLEEQRRTILIDIEEKAMTYLKLRAGINIVHINNAERANSCCGQIQRGWRSKTTSAKHQYFCTQ